MTVAAHRPAQFKTRTEAKADGSGDRGVVEALVAVFGNVDHGGDRILPGAFTDSLTAWAESGDPIPFIWSHDWGNPDAHIGAVTAARETDDGLVVTAELDLDRPYAAQVFHLLKSRRVKQFSFAYDPLEYAWVVEEGQPYEIRELSKLDVFEVGPTLLGMNPDTELIAAAARPTPTGQPAGDTPRDSRPTISSERVTQLLTATRHEEP